jgi:ABC-2 type transport system permease protein
MKRYLTVFRISLQQEFVYRANFVMWRLRNILQFLLIFFLWDSIYAQPQREVFGYDKAKILTYIFALLLVRAFVLSARGIEVGGEIANGSFTNYLLKPISYIKYWLVRDLSSKALNMLFATLEFGLLYLLIKPSFFLQTNPVFVLGFLISVAIAMLIYFLLLFVVSMPSFWYPEGAWGFQFLLTAVFVEFLSGAIFPLDVLPQNIQKLINLTPFPYLIFYPIQIYLGRVDRAMFIKGFAISAIWLLLLLYILKILWNRGLKVYQSYGR